MQKLDEFTTAYLECALWSSTDENDEPMDANYGIEDLTDECVNQAIEDCADFQEANAELLEQAHTVYDTDDKAAYAGHDFWLTRNRHGAGFWDRGLGEVGKNLTEAAHGYGGVDLDVKARV